MKIILFLLLSNCAPRADKENIQSQKMPKLDDISAQVNHTVTALHFFSSTKGKDTFELKLVSKDTLDGQISFKIYSPSKQVIYFIEFESIALLDYGLPTNANDKQKKKYILKRMNEFFAEKNFLNPAIGKNEAYDQHDNDAISRLDWENLRKSDLIGFYYLLGEGDQSWIIFSNDHKKVIKYRSCC